MLPNSRQESTVDLPGILQAVQDSIAPLWPLEDFVAVNPFVGLTSGDFLTARSQLRRWADAEMLMPLTYFGELWNRGDLDSDDLGQALAECRAAYPALFADLEVDDLTMSLEAAVDLARDESNDSRPRADTAPARSSTDPWQNVVVQEIARHCAAHYDAGQAAWSSPWRELPLYQAWREVAAIDQRMDRLGVTGFRHFAARLPRTPYETIGEMLAALAVPPEQWREFLSRQLYSLVGWASYVKYRVRAANLAGRADDDLLGLLAIRLAYEAGLVAAGLSSAASGAAWRLPWAALAEPVHTVAARQDTAIRYALQTAAEIAYRRELLAKLTERRGPKVKARRKTAQFVFCIDVRSEPLRRNLEAVSDEIETFGFAGFFGMAIDYVPLGATTGRAQCPVLLTPSVRIAEGLPAQTATRESAAIARRRDARSFRQLWTGFAQSAVSCFTFVETLGWLSIVKLVRSTLGLPSDDPTGRFEGVPVNARATLGPQLRSARGEGLSADQRLVLAEGLLRKLGLTRNFARLVVICGHGSQTVNNPYQASFDCGACGGHSGEPNARLAAALLNDPAVRRGLVSRGLPIPNDTWFVPALHNTTTDEIQFFDVESLPEARHVDFAKLRYWTQAAALRNRTERAGRLGAASAVDVLRRSRDWSEVRPEWGLAGNAAFIAAPRSRTAGLNLRGRAFLHSYDHAADRDLSVLELIMTAPVVVANWINLQYYASTVDNPTFGSGNKVLHNVVGKFALVQGNGGDLMTGLPWQSVSDGQRLQHEPLRLLVVIEAPRAAIQTILDRQPAVRELATNGWLHLVALEEQRAYRFSEQQTWIAQPNERRLPAALPPIASTQFKADVTEFQPAR